MLFNSAEFLIFFPLVTLGYFRLPHRFRWLWLLLASSYFYMAFVPIYIAILFGTIVIDYFAGIWIENAEGARRKMFLAASIVANVSVLAIFKYYNFLNDTVADASRSITGALLGSAFEISAPRLSILLPIGLSFHTFQAMSYTIEVYRGNQKAERHFGIYALYVMFYPQLVAGPIERPQNVLHQFHAEHRFDAARARSGLGMMLFGFVKKVVIADRLSLVVDEVYASPSSFTAPMIAFATACFAFQIYADFSGYSDIAIGSARVMGVELMTNFRQPYLSRSISEFWSRWHISLSTWFRDYLYIPLGGNRVAGWKWQRNLMLTFLASGLWHGANWTYVIWGGLNGLYLVAANLTKDARAKVSSALGLERFPRMMGAWHVGATFVLICITWVFFRAKSVHEALAVLSRMADGATMFFSGREVLASLFESAVPVHRVALAVAVLGLAVTLDVAHARVREPLVALDKWPRLARWGLYYAAIALILTLGKFGEEQFIYFQF